MFNMILTIKKEADVETSKIEFFSFYFENEEQQIFTVFFRVLLTGSNLRDN